MVIMKFVIMTINLQERDLLYQLNEISGGMELIEVWLREKI